ncbi:hypothetical protein ACHAWO_002331 [Cyclotella atomus]|uniref:Kinesin motor domain-containing protein n=1 Tax=Cyclotella atomus TaxID=382360 RepID=A0ABD3PZR2_9STRA
MSLRALAPSRRDLPRRQSSGGKSSGGRQSSGANMSMERALRSITSPRKAAAGPVGPQKSTMKKGRKRDECGNEENVKVAIRIRPLGSNSSNESKTRAFHANQNTVFESDKQHTYDHVFGEDVATPQVYIDLVQDIVSSVTKDAINGTIFTYGQTSSGKTFTMQGAGETDGIIQYAANDIFESIKQEDHTENVIKISYVEIYNEELRDLLTDNKRKTTSLVIREDKKGSITVENLKEVAVRSLDQLMEVFRVGETNKSIGSTKMNDRSSRSHAILRITIEKKTAVNVVEDVGDEKENNELASPKNNTCVVKTSSTLNLVDLAGSESVRLTGATGMQKKEGGMINQSLLTLSKVLMSLGQKNVGHVNYRDSKLTRILKPSLSGNARMAVICCISPSDHYVDETRSTLQFATRAKLVKTNATANEVVENDADVIAKLRLDLERARLANEGLENQVRELQLGADGSVDSLDRSDSSADYSVRKELDNLKRFLFDDSLRSGGEKFSLHSKSFTDQDIVSSIRSGSVENAVKDDSCRPHSESGDELLRLALADKAKQVKELQDELAGSKKKQQHSRFSLAAYQDIDQYKSQNEELEAKLASANSLISSLGKQVDELSTHKNDALDWIEELFAKSEQKDKQIAQANRERDVALARCKSQVNETKKTKQLLEFTIGEKEDAEARMKAMRSEVEALKYCVNCNNSVAEGAALLKPEIVNLDIVDVKSERDEHNNVSQMKREIESLKEALTMYEEEKRTLVERVGIAESELSTAQIALKAKTEELDDMTFSFESVRKAKTKRPDEANEMRLLVEKFEAAEKKLSNAQTALEIKSKALDDAVRMYECEKKRMVEEIQYLRNRANELEATASESSESSHELQALNEENSALKSEVPFLKRQVVLNNQGSDEMRLLRMQLKSAKQTIAECDSELRQKNDAIKHARTESHELRAMVDRYEKRVKDAEKANVALTVRDKELRDSVSRVRELVESLASENACLKEKISDYKRKLAERDTRGRELDHLFKSAMNERDAAMNEAKLSKASLHQLKESTDKMQRQFEKLNKEKSSADLERETMCLRLDKMAADFEADYETLRHKLDDTLKEKAELEHQFIMLEASKASIEDNADRILERDNALSGQHDTLVAELRKATKELAQRQDEINQMARRLDFLKNETERLAHDNAALREFAKFTVQDRTQPEPGIKKRKIFDFIGEV